MSGGAGGGKRRQLHWTQVRPVGEVREHVTWRPILSLSTLQRDLLSYPRMTWSPDGRQRITAATALATQSGTRGEFLLAMDRNGKPAPHRTF